MRRRRLATTSLSLLLSGVLAGTALASNGGTHASTSHAALKSDAGGSSSANAHGANPNSHGANGAATVPGTGVVALPPEASPIAGKRVAAEAASGTVTVTLPATDTPVPLAPQASIPVGSVVDATHGVVTLTSVKQGSVTQSADFWGGAFRVEQSHSRRPTTVLALVGNLSCARLAVHSAAVRRRSLWGRDHHGRFRTRGRAGVATVRGTVWMTEDTCSGTLFRVAQGAIVVRDYARHANVAVRAGHSYLARSGRHR